MKRILLPLLVIGVLLLGACGAPPAEAPPAEQPAPPEEPEIPLNYTTFSDEAGLFSISYPSDWELALSEIPAAGVAVQDVITSIDSDIPMEYTCAIFLAGLPIEAGYAPNVKIVVESMPGVVWTHDKVVEAKITKIKQIIPDYHELSQVKTTVDGREATILVWEGSYPAPLGGFYGLEMFLLVGKTFWVVTCTPPSGEFSRWEGDFQEIVKSLRIFK